MRYLFLHQNFPGQYKHVVRHLVRQPGNEIVFLSHKNGNQIPGVRKIEYAPARDAAAQTHHYIRELERGILNGQQVARICQDLSKEGFKPDIAIGHNGWGETMFVKDVWPDAPLLGYFEFFYRRHGSDMGFDTEMAPASFDDLLRVRVKNSINLIGIDAADWGQAPTVWQRSQYPAVYQPKISIIHEGVDTRIACPNPSAWLELNGARRLTREDELITYVARNLEPYRGFHTFMRALPEIQKRRPNARVLIVGSESVSYGRKLPEGETYRGRLMAEMGERLDMSRIHFLGRIPYDQFIALLQISSVHVYLTYPFVLSWSMLEAMAAGCLVVGSATPPVMEVIRDGENGLLVDFFSPEAVAARVDEALSAPDRMQPLREAARRTIVNTYDLETRCLPAYLDLIATLAERRRPAVAVDTAAQLRRALDLKQASRRNRPAPRRH